MKKILVPLLVIVLIIGASICAFFYYIQSREQPLLESFRIDTPVSGKQKATESVGKLISFFSTVEEGKKRFGYTSSYRFPFAGRTISIGNVSSGGGFYYLSNLDFIVTPGLVKCDPSISNIGYFSLGNANENISIQWPGYQRSLVYLWGVNNHFKSIHRKGELEQVQEIQNTDVITEIELSPKEYAYIGNSTLVDKLYFQSDFPFKLKFSHWPEHYYVVNPKGESGGIFIFDNSSRRKNFQNCPDSKTDIRYPEGLYVYDPPEFATQGITIKIGLKNK